MDSQQIDFLQSVRSLLLYHQTIGVEDYPACEATARFLEATKTVDTSSVACKEGPKTGIDPVVRSFQELTTGTRDHIADEIRSCISCNLHTKRLLPVPGHGGEQTEGPFCRRMAYRGRRGKHSSGKNIRNGGR